MDVYDDVHNVFQSNHDFNEEETLASVSSETGCTCEDNLKPVFRNVFSPGIQW